jgi:hypothetical protein
MPYNYYDLSIIDKHHILKNTKSPKIVIVGGSNAAFGINSTEIENEFNIPVVNTAVNASVGLGRMLDDIRPYLNKGDYLLVVPEYLQFTGLWNGSIVAYELIFDIKSVAFFKQEYYSFAAEFMSYFKMKTSMFKTLPQRILNEEILPPSKTALYARDGFDARGDFIKHLDKEGFYEKETEGSVDPMRNDEMNFFKNYVDYFSKEGIIVLLSYPSYLPIIEAKSVKNLKEIDKCLREIRDLKVISTPEDYCFENTLLFDSPHHLNVTGRKIRTERLIEDLRKSGVFNNRQIKSEVRKQDDIEKALPSPVK